MNSFFYRVNDYLKAGVEHLIVDPDESFIYTKRKRNGLSPEDRRAESADLIRRYFYYCGKCFHSFKVHDAPHNLKLALCIVTGDVEYAYCGPSCAAGKSGFCNHILALMLKVCKYSLYDCKDVRDLKDEEDENPTEACTSALQNWHKSRLEGIRSQPVREVVVSNPANNAESSNKTGVTCLLKEARKEGDRKRKLQH